MPKYFFISILETKKGVKKPIRCHKKNIFFKNPDIRADCKMSFFLSHFGRGSFVTPRAFLSPTHLRFDQTQIKLFLPGKYIHILMLQMVFFSFTSVCFFRQKNSGHFDQTICVFIFGNKFRVQYLIWVEKNISSLKTGTHVGRLKLIGNRICNSYVKSKKWILSLK